jgi:hypothetical protein
MIPKTFKIFNTEWKVIQPPKINSDGDFGYCDYNTNTIKIRRNLKRDVKEATLLHEQVHAILFTLGYDDLSRNEQFVEQFAQALHQVIKSAE